MAAWFIDDLDQHQIFITDTVRVFYIPKFRIDMEVEEPFLYLRWNDRERGTGGNERLLILNYLDVVDSYAGYIDNPSSATDLMNQIDAMIISGWTNIGAGGDILINKGDILTHDGVSDIIHPAGPDRSLLGYDSTNLDGLEDYTTAQVVADGLSVTDTTTIDITKTVNDIKADVIDDSITFAKMQNIATDRVLGRDTVGSGNIEELTLDSSLKIASGALGINMDTFHIAAYATWAPVDGSTAYCAGHGFVTNTSNVGRGTYPSYACILMGVNLIWGATSTAGSGENISIYIRVNNTTDYLIATVGNTNAQKVFQNYAMNGGSGITLATTDYYSIKIVCPTWVTNPTSVGFQGTIYLFRT